MVRSAVARWRARWLTRWLAPWVALAPCLALAAASVCGCTQPGGFGVDLTLRFDDSISDDALARVTTLSIASAGDETAIYQVPIGRAPERTERLVFRPLATSRTMTLAVEALDVDPDAQLADVIADGTTDAIDLVPGREVAIELVLGAQPGSDLGAQPGTDAGPPDLAHPEGGLPPPADMSTVELGNAPSKCSSISTGAICESFEAGIGSVWSQRTTNGTLTLDGFAYRGSKALKMHANAVPAGTTIDVRLSDTQSFTSPPPDFYVRAFYFIPAQPVNGVQLFSAVQSPSPYYGVQALDAPGGLLAVGDSISGGGYVRSATASPPTNRWFCLEWHVHVAAGAAGLQQVWLDDVEVTDLHTNEPTQPPSPLATLSVGYEFFSPTVANPASDAWVDEIFVDTARIGCSK